MVFVLSVLWWLVAVDPMTPLGVVHPDSLAPASQAALPDTLLSLVFGERYNQSLDKARSGFGTETLVHFAWLLGL